MKTTTVLAIASLLCLAGHRTDASSFDFSAYKPSTLAEAYAKVWADHEADFTFEAAEVKFRVRARNSGDKRPITPETSAYLKRWAEALGHSPEIAALFQSEVRVESAERSFWLPTQDTLLPSLAAEAAAGSEADFFIMYAGARGKEKIFLVNEFRAAPRAEIKDQEW